MIRFLFRQYLASSLGKKLLMALTRFILVLFVMGHMLGNLLIFIGPEAINAYAYNCTFHSRCLDGFNSRYTFRFGCFAHLDGNYSLL